MADFLYRWPSFISSINDQFLVKMTQYRWAQLHSSALAQSSNQNDGNKNVVVVCGILNYEDYVGYHNAKVVCLRKK